MLHSVRVAAAVALFAAATSLQAQSPVAGKWAADFELGMRNVNGEMTSMGTGHARITLELKGDSVVGTWQVLDPAPANGAPATRPLKGVFANGMLKLETEPAVRRVVLNDEEKQIRMVTRYELKLDGDVLAGTAQQVALGGEIEPPSRPFKATREK